MQNYNTKTDYNTKVNKIEKKIIHHNHDEYITTLEINKCAAEDFDFRWKRANLASQSDIGKNSRSNINKKLTKELIKKFSILNGAKYFSLRIFQNDLVFIPAKNTLNILLTLLGLNHGNLMEFQKKVSKI